jgi:hypothetical protein
VPACSISTRHNSGGETFICTGPRGSDRGQQHHVCRFKLPNYCRPACNPQPFRVVPVCITDNEDWDQSVGIWGTSR